MDIQRNQHAQKLWTNRPTSRYTKDLPTLTYYILHPGRNAEESPEFQIQHQSQLSFVSVEWLTGGLCGGIVNIWYHVCGIAELVRDGQFVCAFLKAEVLLFSIARVRVEL